MRKCAVLLPLVCGFLSNPLFARHETVVCGTHAERAREEMFLHRRFMTRRARSAASSAAPVQPHDIGEIALIDDSDGVVDRRNPFDLGGQTLSFLPDSAATSYGFQVAAGSYDTALAEGGTRLALNDDDSKPVALPFAFPFFGHAYRQLFVNSDGNVSFTEGDSTMDRSLGRLAGGPPRIAPLYTDLDPSASLQGVTLSSDPSRFAVSWVRVPLYGSGLAQTFQLRLYPDGRIEMAWADSAATTAVVGISPGRLQGATAVLSFTAGGTRQYNSAIAEVFSGNDTVDIATAAQKFYRTHDDSYDYLVIFNAENVAAGPGIVAFEVTTRSQRLGIGDDLTDIGQEFGSAQRLQAVLNMGPLSEYPADPNGRVPARFITGDTPLTILGHEAGHLFLALASVTDPGATNARPMLDTTHVHWNFLFNSEASLLQGNRIQDDGPAASPRFTTVGAVQGFSALDQYLMGLRAPEEVPPTFVVTNSPEIGVGSRLPQNGVTFNGQRRDVTIGQLIDSAGRRTPDFTVAQRRFRFAFLLIVPSGTTPSADVIAQVETYRTNFETFYAGAVSGRASADATLKRAVHLSAFPAAGVLAGSSATASITLDAPAAAPLTILLHGSTGAMSVPATVTVPAGAVRAAFSIAGRRPGVDTLNAEPANAAYETVAANIQVLDSPNALKLELVSGDRQPAVPGQPLSQPVIVRVTDINRLPYANIAVTGTVTGGGTAGVSSTSDENGLASFRWTPGAGPLNELTLAIANGPTITAVALGPPAFLAGSVVNAASFAPGISPGSIATVFGVNLLGASVSINSRQATVFFTSNRQANFLVPATLAEGAAALSLTTSAGATAPVDVPVIAISPGLFAAVNRGSYIEIYATGLGPLDGQRTVNQPQVTIGATPAQVLYSGLAPGFPGLYQIDAALPADVSATGVTIQLAGKLSNTVQIQ